MSASIRNLGGNIESCCVQLVIFMLDTVFGVPSPTLPSIDVIESKYLFLQVYLSAIGLSAFGTLVIEVAFESMNPLVESL